MQSLFLVLVLSASVALADQGYGYAPKFYCRDTNTSIYAEVCVPGIDTATKPVELNIKNVVDDKYCYTQTSTKCEEQTKPIEREVCTYTYSSKAEKMPATFIQITDDVKTESMKVTACSPTGYKKPHGYGSDSGEHQYCREEYQTQEYRVPLVNAPAETEVDVAVPEPLGVCRTIKTELTEVVCNDVVKEICINFAKYEDGKASVDQTEAILGEPDCDQITLTLATEACRKDSGYNH